MENLKFYKKLREKKYILENKMYIVEGEHLVTEAFNSGLLITLIKLENSNFSLDVNTVIASTKDLKSISLLKSVPDVMGVVKLVTNNEIKGSKIVILDNVQDPGNVGTIIRSACAFNVDTVVFSTDSVSLYNDKMIRASEGTFFKINIVRLDIKETFKSFKEKNIKIYYADMLGNINVDDLTPAPYALVLGSEGKGISEFVRKNADNSIYIKMKNNVESLNVSVSGGIIMYKFR